MKDELKKALAILADAYDFVNEDKAQAYYLFLQDLPSQFTAAAIGSLIKTSDKCPSIAAIRKETKALMEASKGKKTMDTGEAWIRYYLLCKKCDYFRGARIPNDDPVLKRVSRMFSSDEVRGATDEKLSFLRSQFIARYKETYEAMMEDEKNIAIIARQPGLAQLGEKLAERLQLK